MAEDLERLIYKLELDGSAYIEGADKLSASTNKLSQAQEAANKKLAELKKSQETYKQTIKDTTESIKQNEKEIDNLTKKIALLNTSEKAGATAARELRKEIDLIRQGNLQYSQQLVTLKSGLDKTTDAIKTQTKLAKEAEVANKGFASGVTKAYSGLRTLANIIPGLGIGSLVALVAGPLVSAFEKWFDALGNTNDAMKLLKATEESFKGGQSGFVKASEAVNELRLNVDLAKQGFIDKNKVVEEYNTTMGKTAGTVKTLDEVEQKLVEHGDAYIQMMLLKAAANFALGEASKKAFEAEQNRVKKDKEFVTTTDKFLTNVRIGGTGLGSFSPGVDETEKNQLDLAKQRKAKLIKNAEDEKNTFASIAKKFQEDAAKIAKEHHFNFFDDTKDEKAGKAKTAKAVRELRDDFEERKAAILDEIAKLIAAEFETEVNLRKQYDAKLKKALLDLEKDKGLKKGEREELINLTVKLNTGELDKALNVLHKKQADARKRLNDELVILQEKNTVDTINLLQDEFDRRAKLIEFSEDKEIKDATEANQKRLKAFEENSKAIYGEDYQNNKDFLAQKEILVAAGEQRITNITLKAANERKNLSADIFQDLLKAYDDAISATDLIRDEDQAKAIQELRARFNANKISYKDFLKGIEAIKKKHDVDEKGDELATLRNKLSALDRELVTIEDKYSNHYKKLKAQRDKLADDIANKQSAIDSKVDSPDEAGTKKRVETVQEYVIAIAAVADSVIEFWRAANDAESKALDRSISLQEKRVSAAQKIADRGNAEYLKAEEDRLTELNIKRENAARRQLGIDAALQASQLLVGITGAIAKIATPGIGIAETIAAMAVIVGSLAAGYGIVKSLQGNQPKLAKGTKYLKREGQPSGTDTIPIMANEGEAVIPTNKNKAYHPTVAAIYDGTIPAEHLNNFVNHYHKIKAVPQPNYERIREAAELHIGQDGRMSVLLTENNKKLDEHIELQKLTLRAMKNMSVSANIDRNGVAIAVNEYVEQMKIDRKL